MAEIIEKHQQRLVHVKLEAGERCVVSAGEHNFWVYAPHTVVTGKYPMVGVLPAKGHKGVLVENGLDPLTVEIQSVEGTR